MSRKLTKVDWKKINPKTDLIFGTPKKNSFEGYRINISVKDPDTGNEVPFTHQTPFRLSSPIGVTKKDQNGKDTYKVSLSFPTVRFDPVAKKWVGTNEEELKYRQFVEDVDTTIKEAIFKNQVAWFGKKSYKTTELLDELFFHNLWASEKCLEGEYAPLFMAKLMTNKDGFSTKFFDERGKIMEYKDFATNTEEAVGQGCKGMEVSALLMLNSIWVAGKSCGALYNTKQLLIYDRLDANKCVIDPGPVQAAQNPQEEEEEDDSQIAISTEDSTTSSAATFVPPPAKKPRVAETEVSA
jgi:hypothetical protein